MGWIANPYAYAHCRFESYLQLQSVLWGDYNTAVSVAPCDGVYLGSIPSGHTKEHFLAHSCSGLFFVLPKKRLLFLNFPYNKDIGKQLSI